MIDQDQVQTEEQNQTIATAAAGADLPAAQVESPAARLARLKVRYALTTYQPYADAVARVQAIRAKLTEFSQSLRPLREQAVQLDQAAKEAESAAIDAQAGVLLGTVTQAGADIAQSQAEEARAKAAETAARLQEAERGGDVHRRALTIAEVDLRRFGQDATEYLKPQIRAEHEAVVLRAALALRELSAALTAEQEIRDAVEVGPVNELLRLGLTTVDSTGNVSSIRQFIHVELAAINLQELEDFIRLDKFKYGQWIDGFRKAGYPVD